MKLTKVTVAVACIAMLFTACQKDQDLSANKQSSAVLKDNGEDVMAAFFANNRAENTQVFKINAMEGGVLVAEQGTEIVIAPGVLVDADGNQVQGTVLVSVLENYSRTDMAMNNRTTESVFDEEQGTGGTPILTGGSIDLSMETQDGAEVRTAADDGVIIRFPADNTGGVNPDMKIWEGVQSTDQDRDNAWKDENEVPAINGNSYETSWRNRQRINIDVSWSFPGTPTDFKVDLPSGFNNMNTEVFMTIDGLPGMLVSMDVYNPSPIYWTEHTPYINTGLGVHFIAVAQIGTQMYYAVQPSTITMNHFEHITTMTPCTELDIENAFNSIP